MFFVWESNLADNNLVVFDNVIFRDVNLFDSQVFVDLFRVIQVLSIVYDLGFHEESQTVGIKDGKAHNTHQQD